MSTVVASMSEILRVAPWSLRALGYSFGIAERAARFLIWAEAVHGQMLRTLQTCDAQITRSATLPGGGRTRDGRSGWCIDAGGKHLFEAGPPAIDLLTSDVRSQGAGHVTLANATGMGLLAGLCDLAARRGIGCIAVYRAGADDLLPGDVPRAGWLAALPSAEGVLFWQGTEPGAERLLSFCRTWAAPSDGVCRPQIDTDVKHILDGARVPCIGFSGFPADTGRIASQALTAGLEPVDYTERVAAVYRNGLVVDMADLAHLYELEKRTWAPTSERSRAQSGFGKY